MNVTLTGAAGRLGSCVCRALVDAGHTVRATDKMVRRDLPVRIQAANLRDREVCYDLLEGADALIHLGNIPGTRGFDSQTVFNENTTVNMNVLQAAAEQQVQRVVFASSVQVFAPYSQQEHVPPICLPCLPLDGNLQASATNPYGLSKQVAEVMLDYFARTAGVTAMVVRFPYLVDDAIMARIRKFPERWGGARAEGFTFLHFLDAAELLETLLRSPSTGFHLYFAASRENTLMRPAADVIRQHFPEVPLRKPLAEIDSLVDLSALERDTGWSPRHSSWIGSP